MILRLHQTHRDLPYRLIMSDEAHFQLSGEVFNRQNVGFWGTRNPRIFRTKDPHATRVTVWCGVTASGIIGPYFYQDERGVTVSVSGERYRRILRDYVLPLLRNEQRSRDIDWWWQQDGATAHTARDTMRILEKHFGENRLISCQTRRDSTIINWLSHSPDLSASDFFLWGYLKDRVYNIHRQRRNDIDAVAANVDYNDDDNHHNNVNNGGDSTIIPQTSPATMHDLRTNIIREIDRLNRPESEQLLRAVMEEVLERARECVRSDGKHLRDVMFKTT